MGRYRELVAFYKTPEIREMISELRMKELRHNQTNLSTSYVVGKYTLHGLKKYRQGKSLPRRTKRKKYTRPTIHVSLPKDNYLQLCDFRADLLKRGKNMSQMEAIERLFLLGYEHKNEL